MEIYLSSFKKITNKNVYKKSPSLGFNEGLVKTYAN